MLIKSMGYDVYIVEKKPDGSHVELKESSVSWNYNKDFIDVTGKTIQELLNGKKCSDTTGDLKDIIRKFGISHGNAGDCANKLHGMAICYPQAYWEII